MIRRNRSDAGNFAYSYTFLLSVVCHLSTVTLLRLAWTVERIFMPFGRHACGSNNTLYVLDVRWTLWPGKGEILELNPVPAKTCISDQRFRSYRRTSVFVITSVTLTGRRVRNSSCRFSW